MTYRAWFRPPTEGDLAFVASTMRGDDIREVRASNERSPLSALTHGVRISSWSAAVMHGDTATAIMGISPVGGLISGKSKGAPWLLGSTVLHEHPRILLEDGPKVIYAMNKEFRVLENYAYEGSRANLKWLRYVGFTIHPPAPVPGYRGRFHRFTMGE